MNILRKRLTRFFARHPVLREIALWSMPAILFGLVLRLMFLHYSPYAYWGSDSKSYFSFAHRLLTAGELSLDEKRRFVYPILMAPISLLPGAPLRWLAVLQHAFGIVTLLPLAYVVRKSLYHWRWWIIPVTVLYTGLPVLLWYEHELLGETVFVGFILWAFAGWAAWVGEARLQRAQDLFWWFFVPFALFILTKPSGRFCWPGLLIALVLVKAWRKLSLKQGGAIAALMLATLAVGSKKQGAWLFYVATFPLTQLDSPLHAEYKAQIRDLVEPLQNRLDHYYLEDTGPFQFLANPQTYPGRPLWYALEDNAKRQSQVYMDLAIEGVLARPGTFLELSVHRIAASANISAFREGRFRPEYYPNRFSEHYSKAAEELRKGKKQSLPFALGLPSRGPLPDYTEFQKRISPAPSAWTAKVVNAWVNGFEAHSDLVRLPSDSAGKEGSIYNARLTALGYWMIAGILLSLLPAYRNLLGSWAIVAVGYLYTLFLISQANARYFAPAWPVLIVLIVIPADLCVRLVQRWVFRPRIIGDCGGMRVADPEEIGAR